MSRGGESDGEVSSGSRELAAAAASEAQSGVAPPGLSQSGAATACVLETDVRSPGLRQRDGCRDAPSERSFVRNVSWFLGPSNLSGMPGVSVGAADLFVVKGEGY